MRFRRVALLPGVAFACLALAACVPSLRTEVYTISDRPPNATASYRVVLEDGQSDDLEAARLATRIEAEMAQAGYRRVTDAAEDADMTVRFELYDDGPASSTTRPGVGFGASRGTTVASSQSSVAGVGIPLTRRSTVYRHHGVDVSAGAAADPASRSERRYRLELSFVDAMGPSHKVTVSTTTATDPRELTSCLVEAAFEEFPDGDREKREVTVKPKECAVS